MSVYNKYMHVKPRPPPHLDANAMGFWVGWSKMSNLDVMRETAMKGAQFELASTFLSAKNKWDLSESRRWLENEIEAWALDLLDRNQIFKAMHIYQNTGRDPYDEVMRVFFQTKSQKLRENLFVHLEKNDKLTEDKQKIWNLFKVIEEQGYFDKNNISASISYVMQQSDDWKYSIATKIFFENNDTRLASYVDPMKAWLLLLKDNPQLIDYWINVQYKRRVPIRFYNYNQPTMERLNRIFLNLNISEEMVDCITKHNIPEKTQHMILGELSKFGIFRSTDRKDLKAILSHVIRINNIDNLRAILCKPSANVNLATFSKLLISYCLENNLHPVLHECIDDFVDISNEEVDQYLELMSTSYIMCSSWTLSSFQNSLMETSRYLSKNSLPEYFNENSFILLSILLFSKDFSLFNLLSTNTSVTIEDYTLTSETARGILKTFDNLMIIYNKLNGSFHRNSLTHIDLLEKHANITIKNLYEHKFSDVPKLHFNNSTLSEKYGYKKEIDYRFFIKVLRPCHAYKIFTSMQSDSNLNQCYITSCDKVERYAMKKILSHEVVSSCITFIEMLNGKSYALRMYLTAAEIIYKSKVLDKLQINNLFADIDMNCEEIYNFLQTALLKSMKKIKLNLTGEDFIAIVRHFDVLVKYTTLHNLKPPDLILKLFAEQNLWLEFLIFIQMYNYPLGIVLKGIQHFKSASISEHLEHCFKNDIHQEDTEPKPERHSKKYFFSKTGIRSDNYSGSDVSSLSSYGSMPNSLESDILETEILNTKTDLLLLFLRCHNSMDPPKAFQFACRYYRRPLLAVFATCYEPDSMVINWMTWLEVACNVNITHFNYDSATIESESVLKCFRNVLMEGYFTTLYQSFFIFINENPLRYFMEFINGCRNFDFSDDLVEKKLAYFFKKMNAARRNSFVTEMTSDIHFVNNKAWIQTTAIFLLALTLEYGFKTFYDKILFLRFLVLIDINQYFANIACPNFQSILKILEHLFTNSCRLTFDLSAIHNKNRFQEEIDNFIANLVRKKEFNVAINIAEISDLPIENIVILQAEHELYLKRTYYWLEIEDVFRNSKVSPVLAVDFFIGVSEKATGFDKYGMLEVAHSWCRTHKLEILHSVEKKVWLAFLDMENCLNHIPLPDTTYMVHYEHYLKDLEEIIVEPFVLNERQTINLKNTMEALLSNGDLKRALKVERLFGYTCHDLEILKYCLLLAEDIVLIADMSSLQRSLLSKRQLGVGVLHMKRTSTRLFSSSSAPNSPNTSKIENNIEDDERSRPLDQELETLILLEILSENIVHGASVAMKILRSYRSALNMNRSYREVVSCLDPKRLLQEALAGDCKNKLEIITDFIKIFSLSKQEIADIICAELVEAIINYSKSIIDICVLWGVNIDSNFHVILQLLTGDCSILGMKLFALASATHQSQILKHRRIIMDDSILIVELLIKAHDCFTADCNMEGISLVLKRCQTVFASLFRYENWKLVIRLFTGIKRYSELGYVFPVLKDCGQFELLLRKGSRKDLALKTALLDYLNRYCPDDVDLYRVVALHFFLFSEIADLWERESAVLIKRLIQVAQLDVVYNKANPDEDAFVYFRNDDDTRNILKKVTYNYKHASEYHLSGSKLSKAMKASQQAQLAALQLCLFKDLEPDQPCTCIFKLSSNQIISLLLGDLDFYQALILIKAYGHREDWATILFEQYINKNRADYLNNYVATFKMTDTLLHDISRKFMAVANPTPIMEQNMKYLLNGFRSIHTKYRIASELGFMEIVEELLEGNRLCFLKDTVWKSGYRNTED